MPNKVLASLNAVRGMILGQDIPPAGVFVGGLDAPATMIGGRTPAGFVASIDDFVTDHWGGTGPVEFSVEIRHLPDDAELLILWRI